MAININTILQWFKTGKKPTEQQFADSWQSFWHKDEIIPQVTIENLLSDLETKADISHLSDPEAHSELFQAIDMESYKVIDTLVSGGVYYMSADDFGKTLRYNGTAAITITLSTLIPFETGKRFKIYQAGQGQVTFSANGFILNYGADVVPKLYGVYSTAAVEITDASPAKAYVYGKLQLA